MMLFIPPTAKIVSIEDTREINLPHENWIPGVTRTGAGEKGLDGKAACGVDMYDLVRAALRQRPNYIMVGEVRGKETYTMFQAMATGHTTYATMHADSIDSAVKRLIQKPMDIAPAYMPLMNIVASIQRVHLPQSKTGEMTAYRRILSVDEIADYEDYRNTFTWKAAGDSHASDLKNGIMLPSIIERRGLSWKELIAEMKRRENVLRWMRQRNIRSYRDVAGVITEYNAKPEEFYGKEVLADAPAKNS